MNTMQAVKMYTTLVCPFCIRAKALLQQRGVEHIDEIRIDLDSAAREQMMSITGRRTVRRRLRTAMYTMLALGTAVQVTGLFAAGWLGVARKVAGSEQGLDSTTKTAGLLANGVGGGIAVIGGVIFIVLAARLLLARSGRGVTAGPLSSAGAGVS